MVYLENILETMREKTNVVVKLSSSSSYGDPCNPVILQDCCGNHFAKNWLDTIDTYNLRKVFIVDSVIFELVADSPQWVVTLINEQSCITKILDRKTNICAMYNSFYR